MKKYIKKVAKPFVGLVATFLAFTGITRLMSRKTSTPIVVRIPESWRDRDTIVRFRGTKLKINTGEAVGRVIYFMDSYKPVQTAFFEALVEGKKLFWDFGANLGMYTVLAMKHGVQAIAFEPDPSLCQYYIRPTIMLNRGGSSLGSVVCEAVSDKKGSATFWLHRLGNTGAGRMFESQEMGVNPTITVNTDTLDSYLTRYGKPQLVKIHIEGAEVLAIRGSKQIFTGNDAPILIIEFHLPDIAAIAPGTTADDLIDELKAYGYKMVTITEPKYRESMWHVFYKKDLPKKALDYLTPETQERGGYLTRYPHLA